VQLRRAARSGKPDERFLLQKAFNYGRLFYSHLMASKRERERPKKANSLPSLLVKNLLRNRKVTVLYLSSFPLRPSGWQCTELLVVVGSHFVVDAPD
jgi:hypothetical protein